MTKPAILADKRRGPKPRLGNDERYRNLLLTLYPTHTIAELAVVLNRSIRQICRDIAQLKAEAKRENAQGEQAEGVVISSGTDQGSVAPDSADLTPSEPVVPGGPAPKEESL